MISSARWARFRIFVCGAVFAGLFVAVGKRAFTLQVKEADRLRAMAEEQYLREIELPPRRGRILDRNGAELASTAEVDSIYCNPRRLPDPRDAARKLARALGLDRADLEKKLGQRRFFAWVKRKVTPEEVTAVKALELPGVAFTREPRRFYPNRTLAATVMGHAGSEGSGLEGVELAFDSALRGTSSSVQGMRDALGRDMVVDGTVDGPSTARQRRRAHHRPLSHLHHRAGAGLRGDRAPGQGRGVDHDGPAHGRGPGHGLGAYLQPQRSGGVVRKRGPQPRHHRHVRARVDDEDLHDRGGH